VVIEPPWQTFGTTIDVAFDPFEINISMPNLLRNSDKSLRGGASDSLILLNGRLRQKFEPFCDSWILGRKRSSKFYAF